jgi:hypothetical protein
MSYLLSDLLELGIVLGVVAVALWFLIGGE